MQMSLTYNTLGKSELKVSQVSLGTMSLKGGITKLNVDIIHQAHAIGINYFDTADLYERGVNESMVGQALAAVRKDVVLATKVGNQWRSDGSTWDWRASRPYIIKTVESSLSRLQTDYIDLYQLHGGTIDDPIDEIIDAFEQLVKEGKIRYYGISSIRPNVIQAYAERSNISSVMMQYSLLDRRTEMVFPLLQEKEISVIARGALTQGLLLDKPADKYLQFTSSEVLHAKKAVEKTALSLGLSKSSVLLAYVLDSGVVASAVAGIRTLSQLKEIQEAVKQLKQLPETEKESLEKSIRQISYTEHLV
ncbi:Predicted oxidoreductase [Sphingobacterium wenxiniae]|uniref:Predicted oxidoreductase n=2 Tax=Sphingobacterium wenxiniae TaxID=683125 RepID=A0A1I6Q7J9_9SPHI|nr:Predicted oxidoreductase [Sphingobacterium wenxiniae]